MEEEEAESPSGQHAAGNAKGRLVSSSEGTLFSANSKSDDVGKETSGGGVNDGTVDTSGLRFLDAVSAGLDQIFASTNLLSQENHIL